MRYLLKVDCLIQQSLLKVHLHELLPCSPSLMSARRQPSPSPEGLSVEGLACCPYLAVKWLGCSYTLQRFPNKYQKDMQSPATQEVSECIVVPRLIKGFIQALHELLGGTGSKR